MHAAMCENPVADITDKNVTVLGYREPPELEQVGARILTYAANGQWKLNPREVSCKGESLHICHDYMGNIDKRIKRALYTLLSSSIFNFNYSLYCTSESIKINKGVSIATKGFYGSHWVHININIII